jgi:hypothetical protein
VSVPEGRVEVLTIIERYNTKLTACQRSLALKTRITIGPIVITLISGYMKIYFAVCLIFLKMDSL